MLFESQRPRPAILDRIAKPMQRADARIAAPGKDQTVRRADADQLVVDQVGRHPHQRQVLATLTHDFVARREGNEVSEALHGHTVAVAYVRRDGFGKRAELQYRSGSIFCSSSSRRLAKNGGICIAVPNFSYGSSTRKPCGLD